MNTQKLLRLALAWCLLLLPVSLWAQISSATIAGVVKDSSGGVLPGVTVEASSPALIEKTRSVVTDDQGLYRMVDLRPGVYTVTFTLPGFSTFRREDLELTTSFTATVNADLRVGALEESITVSGLAPVVDTQNSRQQTTIGRSTLDAIPTTKRLGQYASVIPGATYSSPTFQDVGGAAGEGGQFGIHGQRAGDLVINVEGLNQNLLALGVYSFNANTFQEVVLQTSGGSAEAVTGGVQVNIVAKDGGNAFSGNFSASYAGPKLQSENLTPELSARGLTSTPGLKKTYDNGGAIGGPIKRDQLWFLFALRGWGAQQYAPGAYYNATRDVQLGTDPTWHVSPFTPDTNRIAFANTYHKDASIRITWQAAAKHKIVGSYSIQPNCSCTYGLIGVGSPAPSDPKPSPEALDDHHYNPNYLPLVSWSYPATNRLLFEAGASANIMTISTKRLPETGPYDIGITDLGTNLVWGSRPAPYVLSFNKQYRQRFAASYVTGSHAFKTGFDIQEIVHSGGEDRYTDPNRVIGSRDYTFRDMAPLRVRIWAMPSGTEDSTRAMGLFAQDQWTVRRMTLNLGLRYDSFNGSVPEQHLPAGPFVPARDFPAVKDSPNWTNLNPRLGASYDVFGNGKTALKFSLGRFVPYSTGATFNPVSAQAQSTTRTWNDSFYGAGDPRTGNYVPDCDLLNPAVNGECGLWSELTFGQVRASTTRYADDALTGYNGQFNNWQGSVSVQQQLRPGMALNVGYFRTWYDAFTATDNQFWAPENFDEFCVTAPVDSRLGPSSGQRFCELFDITPTLFGQTDNLVTQASHYGKQIETYNGLDVTLNTRFGQGGQFSGGVSLGHTVTDNCFVVDSPQQTRTGFCRVDPPWSSGTQVKFLVVYPLPWELQTSATYQNTPGIPVTASYPATNAEIKSSLQRDLASCRGAATCNQNVNVDLIPANSMFEDRLQQVDLRFSRIFNWGKTRVRGNFDIYNLLNGSAILSENLGYGKEWLKPVQILGGRVFKFSGQIDF